MVNTLDAYPSIRRAALAIAYDNGMINRRETEADFLSKVETQLAKHYSDDLLKEYDDWLRGLTDEENETVCNGDVEDAKRLLVDSPGFIEDMIEDIFQVV